MQSMTNLLDIMTPEDRDKMKVAFDKRMAGDGTYKKDKIPPLVYLLAEAGVYFGWQAIVDAKRGYTEAKDDEGNIKKIPLSMEEFNGLVMAGRKFRFSDNINRARTTQIGVGSLMQKSKTASQKVWKDGVEALRKEFGQ